MVDECSGDSDDAPDDAACSMSALAYIALALGLHLPRASHHENQLTAVSKELLGDNQLFQAMKN